MTARNGERRRRLETDFEDDSFGYLVTNDFGVSFPLLFLFS